jgi:hypothetical protein
MANSGIFELYRAGRLPFDQLIHKAGTVTGAEQR